MKEAGPAFPTAVDVIRAPQVGDRFRMLEPKRYTSQTFTIP